MQRMGEAASQHKQLVAGDTMTVEWLPGNGTTRDVKGKAEVGPYTDAAFFTAMAKIWRGKTPADHLLKDALLGIAPKRVENRESVNEPDRAADPAPATPRIGPCNVQPP